MVLHYVLVTRHSTTVSDTNFSGNTQGPAAYNDPVSPLGDGGATDANPGLLNDATGGGTTAANYERAAGNIAREDAEALGSGSTLFNEMSQHREDLCHCKDQSTQGRVHSRTSTRPQGDPWSRC